ncbi:unnamed protein product [Prorocentrum cordatum]|uniref:Uncharacterized protein n=1 Tax=Prorocentrum cordatum TaxID=2364126 RepID=A0ABN9P6H2_9DINO|nr:unnamed protein product [Polarella glacialis]
MIGKARSTIPISAPFGQPVIVSNMGHFRIQRRHDPTESRLNLLLRLTHLTATRLDALLSSRCHTLLRLAVTPPTSLHLQRTLSALQYLYFHGHLKFLMAKRLDDLPPSHCHTPPLAAATATT